MYVIIIDTNEESTIKFNKVAQIDSFCLFIFFIEMVSYCHENKDENIHQSED